MAQVADFRSWIIAHGQVAVEWVLDNPENLAAFPDLTSGCGLGEPFGYAALDVYLRKAGRGAGHSGLPQVEPTSAPG